jgi:hypothetical protein
MFGLSKALTNFFFTRGRETTLDRGSFSLLNTFTTHVGQDGYAYNRVTEARTDFSPNAFTTEVRVTTEGSTPYGVNAEFVTPEGVINHNVAHEFMAKSVAVRRVYKDVIFSDFNGHLSVDAQEAYLFNLMISWFKASIAKKSGNKAGDPLLVPTGMYEDSHVEVDPRGFGTKRWMVEIGPPVALQGEEDETFVSRAKDNFFECEQVFKYASSSKAQEAFYLIHLFGREGKGGLHVDVTLPSADLEDLLVDKVGGGPVRFKPNEIDWYDDVKMWRWIMDYAEVNRLTHQLATVLEMFTQLGYQPKASSAEGMLWGYGHFEITLPMMKFTRAVLPVLLEGEQYMPSATPAEARVYAFPNPFEMILHGAVDNVYFWLGMYQTYQAAALECEPWEAVFEDLGGNILVKNDALQRASMLSAISGSEVVTLYSNVCNVVFNTERMAGHLDMTEITRKVATNATNYRCIAVPIYTTGSLVIGTVSDPTELLAHLEGAQVLNMSDDKPYIDDNTDLLKLANVYRIFGYDTEIADVKGNTTRAPWARAHECVIDAYSVLKSEYAKSQHWMNAAYRRPGRSGDFLPLSAVRHGEQMKITFTIPEITVKQFERRVQELKTVKKRRTETKRPLIRVSAQSVVRNVIMRPAQPKKDTRQDFQSDEAKQPPRVPMTIARERPTIEDAGGDTTGVEDATLVQKPPIASGSGWTGDGSTPT